MRFVFNNYNSHEVQTRAAKAKEDAKNFTWQNAANKAISFLRSLEEIADVKRKKMLVVSPYNDETGIAEYTEKIYSNVSSVFDKFTVAANVDISNKIREDEDFVVRNWSLNDSSFSDLLKFINTEDFDFVHFQYHSGAFTNSEDFSNLLGNVSKLNAKIFVTLHAVRSKDFDFIKSISNLILCEKVLIHNQSDLNHAKDLGLENATLLPLYKTQNPKRSKSWLRKKLGISENIKIIATHGLLNTNKGIPEVIKATAKLQNLGFNLLCLNAVSQNNIHAGQLLKDCNNMINELKIQDKVRFITDFLPEDIVNMYLEISDYIVFNYSDAGESASAAVNKGLASRNPVLITDIPQFSEFNDECLKLNGNKAEDIIEAISKLEGGDYVKKELIANASEYIDAFSNHRVALKQLEILMQ